MDRVSQLKETFGKMKTLSFDPDARSKVISSRMSLPDISIDRQEIT